MEVSHCRRRRGPVVRGLVSHAVAAGANLALTSGACFSKVPKLFGPISGATTSFISWQCRGSKPSNFAILLGFLISKTCKKIRFSKQAANCSLTTSFSGSKSSRDVRETGPWSGFVSACCGFNSTSLSK